ncbi:MAG: ABC transporter permease [Erysipelotrichaceae bacterium]|nr:ABC transporter permease [Erysipelotrichaceae bacterium]
MSNIFTLEFITVIIRLTASILLASLASFAASTTGIGNIAIEGIMTMSALFGILGSHLTRSAIGGLVVGVLVGVIIALSIAFFSMRLGASPILVGIAMNTFSSSLALFILYQFTGEKGSSAKLFAPTFGSVDIPIIKDIPILGTLLSGHLLLVYVAVLITILFYILVYKTPLGMRMRACGLNPDAARTAGINVEKLQILSLIFSGIFAALGGIYLSMNYGKIFSNGLVVGQGWMGIAANGVAGGNYGLLILSALVFGTFRAVAIKIESKNFGDLIAAFPYLAVFVVLVVIAIVNTIRIKRGNVAEQ